MYVYCLNNPVMMRDVSGEVGVIAIICGAIGLAMILVTPSSQMMEATPEQIDAAQDAADRAEVTVRTDDSGNPYTVDIHIDTGDALNTVDTSADDYYYERLYNRMTEVANVNGIPSENLMTLAHIEWEFGLHVIAFQCGIENAIITDLNVEETLWSMIGRAIGWD